MILADMENSVLAQMQQPGIVAFGSPPNFAAVPSPAYSKDRIDFYLNRWYIKLMDDIAELELYMIDNLFQSTLNTYAYNIPNGTPGPGFTALTSIAMVIRVSYQPVGLNYEYEFQQGVNLLSWDEYQKMTGYGYYQQLSFGVQPRVCSVSPERTQLYFYPGSAQSGDNIRLRYAPLPTAGSGMPLLANATDKPVIPDDCHDCIVQGALSELWINDREFQMAMYAKAQYDAGLKRIRERYLKRSKGDTFGIVFPDYPMPLGMEP
jgi:hypothetical protein